jgi:seryl-tRNA synthetase
MLDINYIRSNQKMVSEKSAQKGYKVDIPELIRLDDLRRKLRSQVDSLRQERNQLAHSLKNQQPDAASQEKGRDLKQQLSSLEDDLKKIESDYIKLLKAVPNMPLPDVPIGSSESENVIEKTVGDKPHFDFIPLAHQDLGDKLDLIDKMRAAKISGSRFAYLKGDLVRMQFAIIGFVIGELTNSELIAKLIKDNGLKLSNKPFLPILPPALLKTGPYEASARLNAEEVTYKIDQDDLWLNASAEHTLCTMYMNEVIDERNLPIRLLGYSTSFRREAGSYGKDIEGIFRLHQFDKLEMEVLSDPDSGLDEHKLLVAIQEYLVSSLGLSYQLINKCTADIGKPNARGVDINTWFPSQNTYRETHTADYMTDYQTRDLRIRLKTQDGLLKPIHTNDATAFALGRIMAAIVENFQDSEGHITIPTVLRPFMGGQTKI